MFKTFLSVLLAFVAPGLFLHGQQPLDGPTPLVAPTETSVPAGQMLLTLSAARSAQELGFPSAAIALYREVLQQAEPLGAARGQVVLALTTALMDEGSIAAAEEALQTYTGLRGSAWYLRSALIAAHQRRIEAARAARDNIRPNELSAGDLGWWYFLEGLLAEAGGDLRRANAFYEQAEGTATTPLQEAKFLLAKEQARLRTGPITPAAVENARRNAERLQGQRPAYDFVRQYAVVLDGAGRKNAAIDLLQAQLRSLPAEERVVADDLRLSLGLIAGAREGVGRNALTQLVAVGRDPEKQRVALQLLARASQEGAARVDLRRRLDEWLAVSTHPIREDLLLSRAQLALGDKNFELAEADARTVLELPGARLKAHAYLVRTSSAWEQRRYLTAADNAIRARAELTAAHAQARAQLSVLVAEAWYRAGDFRSAADAYGAALNELPAGVSPGSLMFHRVLAEIEFTRLEPVREAERLLAVEDLLDDLARDPRFEPVNRWQAEWNLARALQRAGQVEAAYTRVNHLLAASPLDAPALPPELQARMVWLQMRLSLDAGQPEQTLRLADELRPVLEPLSPAMRAEVASSAALLRAQANIALGRDPIETLVKLRQDFPNSDAEIYSYIVEADYYVAQENTVEAERRLVKLADDHPQNKVYAPFALLRAAELEESRGQQNNFEVANELIERLVRGYPQSPLIFTARFRQGELLRRMNQLPQALQAYEAIVNGFPQHPGLFAALLAKADTHSALAAEDPGQAEQAMAIYERLFTRPDVGSDLRVEAGFKYGNGLVQRGNFSQAQAVWWGDVVNPFLLEPRGVPVALSTGRYWLARTLVELGALYERQEKLDEARKAWQLIVDTDLPLQSVARSRLARFSPLSLVP